MKMNENMFNPYKLKYIYVRESDFQSRGAHILKYNQIHMSGTFVTLRVFTMENKSRVSPAKGYNLTQ